MIDARSFAQSPVISRADFFSALERNLNEFISSQTKWGGRILNALKSIKGVEVSAGPPTSVSLSWGTPRDDTADLAGLFASLGKVAESKDKDTRFIIAFDEAQEFRRLAGYDLAKLLAHIYDFIPWAFLVRSRLRDSYLPDRYFFAKVGDFDFTSRVFMPEAVLLLQLSRGGRPGRTSSKAPQHTSHGG